jgi:hypothetical protein
MAVVRMKDHGDSPRRHRCDPGHLSVLFALVHYFVVEVTVCLRSDDEKAIGNGGTPKGPWEGDE